MAESQDLALRSPSHPRVPPCRSVVADTDVILVRWDVDAIESMAGGSYPALAASWRNLILYNLAMAFAGTCGDVSCSIHF